MRDDGFTIVELMVALAMGIVVMFAVLGLVEATTRDSARIAARIEANQLARPVLQHMTDELHSTCLGPNVTPIQGGAPGAR